MGEPAQVWSFQIASEPSYGGNLGYEDDPHEVYQYDSKVQYHAQIEAGDVAVIVVDDEAIGIAQIDRIEKQQAEKTLQRCPNCRTTSIRHRRTSSPAYRCDRCKNEFDQPKDDVIDVTQFRAYLSDFEELQGISSTDVRNAAQDRGLTAIRPLDPDRVLGLVGTQAPQAAGLLPE